MLEGSGVGVSALGFRIWVGMGCRFRSLGSRLCDVEDCRMGLECKFAGFVAEVW